MTGDLTDQDILIIAKEIRNVITLRRLSIQLYIPQHELEIAIMNNKANISEASYMLLQGWFCDQMSRQKAFEIMMKALLECGLKGIAAKLIRTNLQGT